MSSKTWEYYYMNDDQRDHWEYLRSLPPEAKCDCGWAERGDCMGACAGRPERGGYVFPDRAALRRTEGR